MTEQTSNEQFSRWEEMKKDPAGLFVIFFFIALPLLNLVVGLPWFLIIIPLALLAVIIAPFRMKKLRAQEAEKAVATEAGVPASPQAKAYGEENGVSALVFGILGFALCWPLGVYAFFVARKARKEAEANDGLVDSNMQMAYFLGLLCTIFMVMVLVGALLAGISVLLN